MLLTQRRLNMYHRFVLDYSTTSTLGSTLRGKHIMGVSPSNKIFSSPASYTRLSTQLFIDSSSESLQQRATSIFKVQVTPTGASPMCCGSTMSDDTVMFQVHGQRSHDFSKTITDSLMRTAKGAAYTANSVSRDATRGRSARPLSATTLETDSPRTRKETYSTSIEQTRGQNIPSPSSNLQMVVLRTGNGPYSTSLEMEHGQNILDPSTTLQMDSLGKVKGTNSAHIDQTHGQNTLEPSPTLQIDSLRTATGTNSAYIDQTSKQSTRSLSRSPHTDSLMIRTVKGGTDYGVSTVQDGFIALEQSEKSSNFHDQSQVSSFQVQPSFSSLSPTISPSHTGK